MRWIGVANGVLVIAACAIVGAMVALLGGICLLALADAHTDAPFSWSLLLNFLFSGARDGGLALAAQERHDDVRDLVERLLAEDATAAEISAAGRYDEARQLYLSSTELNERLGNEVNIAGENHNLLYVAHHRANE